MRFDWKKVAECNWNGSLGEIEREDEDSVLASEDAADIGGADVSAAGVKNVHPAGARDEIAERDRPDQVRHHQCKKGKKHFGWVWPYPTRPSWRRACGPPLP